MHVKPQAISQSNCLPRQMQCGFVAVLLLVMMAVAAVTALTVNVWGSGANASLAEQKITQDALKQAKEALLSFVEIGFVGNLATFTTTPIGGRLPCPDQNGDGITAAGNDLPCGGAGAHRIGLFPWGTLGLPVLRDGSKECLWYAVDGLSKTDTETTAVTPATNVPAITVNTDSSGSFSVIQPVKNPSSGSWTEALLAGNTNSAVGVDMNRVVAVIMAPGSTLGAQTRATAGAQPCATPTGIARADAAQYLENYTGTTNSGSNQLNSAALTAHTSPIPIPNTQLNTFIQADVNQEKLNDQIVFITAEEFSRAATRRTARLYANAIRAYVTANGSYPRPAAIPGGACTTAPPLLLQGFMPMACPAVLGAPNGGAALTIASSLLPDNDWWQSQAHYAVSEDCVNGGANAPCAAGIGGGAFLNTGGRALILMRGRPRAGQLCTLTSAAAAAPLNMSLCLEGVLNPLAVSTLPANANPPAVPLERISRAVFERPSSGSNDHLIQLP